jgi:hypothetical protein
MPHPSAGAPATPPPASTEYNPNGSGKNNGLSHQSGKQPDTGKWPPITGRKDHVEITQSQLDTHAKELEADLAELKKALDKVQTNGAAPGYNVGVQGDATDLFQEVLSAQHKAFTTYFTELQASYQEVANGLRTALGNYKQAETNATPTYTSPQTYT